MYRACLHLTEFACNIFLMCLLIQNLQVGQTLPLNKFEINFETTVTFLC